MNLATLRLKTFCYSKDPIKKTKRQATSWETSVTYIVDRRLACQRISRILTDQKGKDKQPTEKCMKDIKRYFKK